MFRYWGKARPFEGDGAQYHLLPFHCLDVAAVGTIYLRQSGALLKSCCQLLNCSEDAFLSWSAFLFALHDLGKFSEAFQSQRPDVFHLLQGREPNPTKLYTERHDSLGFWLWDDGLADEVLPKIGINDSKKIKRSLSCWLRAVTGHHGMPPKTPGRIGINSFFCKEDKQVTVNFVNAMAKLLLTSEAKNIPQILEPKDFQHMSECLSWWFAGATVLADWLGSNTDFFPYHDKPQDLKEYWIYAQSKADLALTKSGVLPKNIAVGKTITDLFPYIQDASPLQKWASSVEIPPAPQLYLLEDITGAGKTEAAILLSYRLMEKGFAEGFFIGLPTMATANAMYKRVAKVYQQLFGADANLVLAHGHKKLVEEFAATILPSDKSENDASQLDETASARCTAWLADHSKRALLSSAGVGTIDQALLAVLHSKHQSLRLLGLFNKVLIVDEVHACDPYMQGVLEVLLEFHARADGSVILLSATLPNKMKQSLINAYARGRNQTIATHNFSVEYPLATNWNESQPLIKEQALTSRKNVTRTVQVKYEADQEKIFKHMFDALEQGKCVGWIRNTVVDAMDAYSYFSQIISPEKITLFHARFVLRDRLDKEESVLALFGKKSQFGNRQGQLMIATQVAEQSLDVDFDELITDLAPIDRVIQRAGRLQRHIRDKFGNRIQEEVDQRSAPCLWVFAPGWTLQPQKDWYGAKFKKAQYVYKNHGQLWLTANVLQKKEFTMPDDAREMIETVFSEFEPLPEGLAMSALNAEGQEMSEASIAQTNTLKMNGGYSRGNMGDWWSDAKTPSRLGEETTEIMLAKWVNGNYEKWSEGAWAYSMVKIAVRSMDKIDPPTDGQQNKSYFNLKQTLPSQGKWCLLLPLSQNKNGIWQGHAWTAANKKGESPKLVTWLYDSNFGLRVAENQTEEIIE